MDPGKCSCGAVWQKEYEVCTSCGKTRPPAVNQLPLLGPRCPSACVIDLPRSAKFCFNCGAPAVYSETKEGGRVLATAIEVQENDATQSDATVSGLQTEKTMPQSQGEQGNASEDVWKDRSDAVPQNFVPQPDEKESSRAPATKELSHGCPSGVKPSTLDHPSKGSHSESRHSNNDCDMQQPEVQQSAQDTQSANILSPDETKTPGNIAKLESSENTTRKCTQCHAQNTSSKERVVDTGSDPTQKVVKRKEESNDADGEVECESESKKRIIANHEDKNSQSQPPSNQSLPPSEGSSSQIGTSNIRTEPMDLADAQPQGLSKERAKCPDLQSQSYAESSNEGPSDDRGERSRTKAEPSKGPQDKHTLLYLSEEHEKQGQNVQSDLTQAEQDGSQIHGFQTGKTANCQVLQTDSTKQEKQHELHLNETEQVPVRSKRHDSESKQESLLENSDEKQPVEHEEPGDEDVNSELSDQSSQAGDVRSGNKLKKFEKRAVPRISAQRRRTDKKKEKELKAKELAQGGGEKSTVAVTQQKGTRKDEAVKRSSTGDAQKFIDEKPRHKDVASGENASKLQPALQDPLSNTAQTDERSLESDRSQVTGAAANARKPSTESAPAVQNAKPQGHNSTARERQNKDQPKNGDRGGVSTDVEKTADGKNQKPTYSYNTRSKGSFLQLSCAGLGSDYLVVDLYALLDQTFPQVGTLAVVFGRPLANWDEFQPVSVEREFKGYRVVKCQLKLPKALCWQKLIIPYKYVSFNGGSGEAPLYEYIKEPRTGPDQGYVNRLLIINREDWLKGTFTKLDGIVYPPPSGKSFLQKAKDFLTSTPKCLNSREEYELCMNAYLSSLLTPEKGWHRAASWINRTTEVTHKLYDQAFSNDYTPVFKYSRLAAQEKRQTFANFFEETISRNACDDVESIEQSLLLLVSAIGIVHMFTDFLEKSISDTPVMDLERLIAGLSLRKLFFLGTERERIENTLKQDFGSELLRDICHSLQKLLQVVLKKYGASLLSVKWWNIVALMHICGTGQDGGVDMRSLMSEVEAAWQKSARFADVQEQFTELEATVHYCQDLQLTVLSGLKLVDYGFIVKSQEFHPLVIMNGLRMVVAKTVFIPSGEIAKLCDILAVLAKNLITIELDAEWFNKGIRMSLSFIVTCLEKIDVVRNEKVYISILVILEHLFGKLSSFILEDGSSLENLIEMFEKHCLRTTEGLWNFLIGLKYVKSIADYLKFMDYFLKTRIDLDCMKKIWLQNVGGVVKKYIKENLHRKQVQMLEIICSSDTSKMSTTLCQIYDETAVTIIDNLETNPELVMNVLVRGNKEELLWRLFEKSFCNTASQLATFQHFLEWPATTAFIRMYGKSKAINHAGRRKFDSCLEFFQSMEGKLREASITFDELSIISSRQEQFSDISIALYGRPGTQAEKHRQELNLLIQSRKNEWEFFQTWKGKLAQLIQICRLPQGLEVDLRDIQEKLSNATPKTSLSKLCQMVDGKLQVVLYSLPDELETYLDDICETSNSTVFCNAWKAKGQRIKETVTLENIVSLWFKPVQEKLYDRIESLLDESILLCDIDKLLSDFKRKEQLADLKKDLSLLINVLEDEDGEKMDCDDEEIAAVSTKVMKYFELKISGSKSATVITLGKHLRLTGNFDIYEDIRRKTSIDKQTQLESLEDSHFEAAESLRSVTDDMENCMTRILKCMPIILWLREELKDLRDVKTFVDLLSISAGETDYEADRVSCLHTVCLAFEPIIFQLKPKSGPVELINGCESILTKVAQDPNLLEKLVDSNRYLEWFKKERTSYGSVATSSMMEAEAANRRGYYNVGVSDQFDVQTSTISLENSIHLFVPEESNKSKPEEPKDKTVTRKYSLSEIGDLQSKLMLIGGKQGKEREMGQKEKDYFLRVFETVTRIANLYVTLCNAGCNKYFKWKKNFYCHFDEMDEDRKDTVAAIEEECEIFEKDLETWGRSLHQKRWEYPHLNFFTIRQLVFMQTALKTVLRTDNVKLVRGLPPQVFTLLEEIYPEINHVIFTTVLTKSSHDRRYGQRWKVDESWRKITRVEDKFVDISLKKIEDFIDRLEREGHDEDVAKAAMMECGLEDFHVTSAWGLLHNDDEEKISDLAAKMDKIMEKKAEGGDNEMDDDRSDVQQIEESIAKKAEEELEFLSLDEVGMFLEELVKHRQKKQKKRKKIEIIKNTEPNLLIVPKDDLLCLLIDVYKRSGDCLPTAGEVEICNSNTSLEKVELLFRRALMDPNGIYTLAFIDELDYNVSEQAFRKWEVLLNDYAERGGCNKTYNLLLMCSSEKEDVSFLASALDNYRIMSHPCPPASATKDFLTSQCKIDPATAARGVEHAAKADLEKSTVRVVKSNTSGTGKSLYIQRVGSQLNEIVKRSDAASRQLSSSVDTEMIVTISMQGTSVNQDEVVKALLPFEKKREEAFPRIYHFDIAATVTSNLDSFIFQLLVLGSISTSTGSLWKRKATDLYMLEITEHSLLSQQDNESGGQKKKLTNVGNIIPLLPTTICRTPKETFDAIEKSANVTPGFDAEEFKSVPYQRVYQYLKIYDGDSAGVETFTFDRKQVRGDHYDCLRILLRYCGVADPSWREIKHFVRFFDNQVSDCEMSVFCDHLIVGDTLPGFKAFVVKFMLQMSKDFATPSVDDDDQQNNNGLIILRRSWEKSEHPYLFFNQDRVTMSFLGFTVNLSGHLMDKNNLNVITRAIMHPNLYLGLQRQGVELFSQYDKWPRHRKILTLCKVMGIEDVYDPDETYELTMDNMMKILAIHMRFRSGIPVILMGETGCGKTRLIRFMCKLKAGPCGPQNMLLVKVHGGVTEDDVKRRVEQAVKLAQKNHKERRGLETVLFFDEANTTSAIGLVKEIMCDMRMAGKRLNLASCGLQIIAACNPYRKHTDDMIAKLESSGLGYNVKAKDATEKLGKIPLRQLVYRVHPLPESMLPLVWDFGQLSDETETLYAAQIVHRYAREKKIPTDEGFLKLVTITLAASQSHMRRQKDECSFVSLRDVERAVQVLAWFYSRMDEFLPLIEETKNKMRPSDQEESGEEDDDDDELSIEEIEDEEITKMRLSLVLALTVCYAARLEKRDSYYKNMAKHFRGEFELIDGKQQIKDDVYFCQQMFLDQLQLGDNIAKNTALSENVFMMVICIELRIPLFVVGKPGSSKSLAKTIIQDNMQGTLSHSDLFKKFKQILMCSYQCSPLSTAEGIIGTFRQCSRFQEGKDLDTFASVVVLDEVGLAEDSPRMPLKALHPLLEDGTDGSEDLTVEGNDSKAKRVAFVGISNWALDPAKMNRGLMLTRGQPDQKELVTSADGICSSDGQIKHTISRLFEPLAKAYLHIYKEQRKSERLVKSKKEEFFGLRDYYSLIKMIFNRARKNRKVPTLIEIEHAVKRNFGGLEDFDTWDIFRRELASFSGTYDSAEDTERVDTSPVGLLRSSLRKDDSKRDTRYVLLMTENYAALRVLEKTFPNEYANASVIFGSSFPKDQEFAQICRDINKIKVCMETGMTVILLNMENLYESLYDALNQYYVYLGGQRYVDLGLGTHRVKCRVHEEFKLIVVAEKDTVYNSFPIPLINRLEKHFLVMSTSMDHRQIKLCRLINHWAEDFAVIKHRRKSYSLGDAFIGFNDDTAASVVLETMHDADDDTSDEEILERSKRKLLHVATPEAVTRLSKTPLSAEADDIWDLYFNEQNHNSLGSFLASALQTTHRDAGISAQVTTFSRLLSPRDQNQLEEILEKRYDIKCISINQFQTEQQFSEEIRRYIKNKIEEEKILLVQCDNGDENSNLIASARHLCQQSKITHTEELSAPLHIIFIVNLRRVAHGCQHLGSFHGAHWLSIHIDELRPSSDELPMLTEFANQKMSFLFKPFGTALTDTNTVDESVESGALATGDNVQEEYGPNMHLQKERESDELSANDDPDDMQHQTEAMIDDDTEMEAIETDEMKPISPKHAEESYTLQLALLRRCVQASVVKTVSSTDAEDGVRVTRRIHLLLDLLSQGGSFRNSDFSHKFAKVLLNIVYKVLKEKENQAIDEQRWFHDEAVSGNNIQECGTFRRALSYRIEKEVVPILSSIITQIDMNSNLDLITEDIPWKRDLWLTLFCCKDILNLNFDDLAPLSRTTSNRKKTDVKFNCWFPFSSVIREKMIALFQAHIKDDFAQDARQVITTVLEQTQYGKDLLALPPKAVLQVYLRDLIYLEFDVTCEEHELIAMSVLARAKNQQKQSKRTSMDIIDLHLIIRNRMFRQRIHCFLIISQQMPDILKDIKRMTDDADDMVIDAVILYKSLESLFPKQEELIDEQLRFVWCNEVQQMKLAANQLLSLFTEQQQEFSVNSTKLLSDARVTWTRIQVLRMFVEHICPPGIASRKEDVVSALNLWETLEDLEDDLSSVDSWHMLEDSLKNLTYQSTADDDISSQSDIEGECMICNEALDDPVQFPCLHVVCYICARRWLEEESHDVCLTCQSQLPTDFKVPEEKSKRQMVYQLGNFKRRCIAFFMEAVSTFCFSSKNPVISPEVIDLMMSYVTTEKQETKIMSPFPDYGVDPTPTVRSFLVQQLLKAKSASIHAEDYLRKYLENSNQMNEDDQQSRLELCLLLMHCYEDFKMAELSSKSSSFESHVQVVYSKLQRIRDISGEDRQITDISSLQMIAEIRVVMSRVAEIAYDDVIDGRIEGEMKEKMQKMYSLLANTCMDSESQNPRNFFLRQLLRKYGSNVVRQFVAIEGFEWLWPEENNEMQQVSLDKFIIYGDEYKALREKIGEAAMKGEIDDLVEHLNDSTESDISEIEKEAYAILALFREITSLHCKQSPENEFCDKLIQCLKENRTITDHKLARVLVENRQGNGFDKLKCSTRINSRERDIAEIVIHTMIVLSLKKDNLLLQPLALMMVSPNDMQQSYLPTMPDDHLTEVFDAGAGVWRTYSCPNGHPYVVTECGQPLETRNCPECGAPIGGRNHVPNAGNVEAQRVDRTQTGHILGDPHQRLDYPVAERLLQPASLAVVSVFLHSSLLLGACNDENSVAQMIHPPEQLVGMNQTQMFMWRHLVKDVEILAKATGKSIEDTILFIHIILTSMLKDPMQHSDNFGSLASKNCRQDWEDQFNKTFIQPNFANLGTVLNNEREKLLNDKRLGANPIMRHLYELDIEEDERDLGRPAFDYVRFWRYRTPVTVTDLKFSLNEFTAKKGKMLCKILQEFLDKESTLRWIKVLPEIIKLQKMMSQKLELCIRSEDAQSTPIKNVVKKYFKVGKERDEVNALLKVYFSAWRALKPILSSQITLDEGYEMTNSSPVGYLLPSINKGGRRALMLVKCLAEAHNELVAKCREVQGDKTKVKRVRIQEATNVHLVAYDHDADLIPMFYAHCDYSLEIGKGTTIDYNFPALERQLVDTLIRGKPLLDIEILAMKYADDLNSISKFEELEKRIEQRLIPISEQHQMAAEFHSLPEVCDALRAAEISIGLLSSTGAEPNVFYKKYLEDVLRMPASQFLVSGKMQSVCRLAHIRSIWLMLTVERAFRLYLNRQDPFDVDDMFRENIQGIDAQVLRNVDIEHLLAEITEYIVLELQLREANALDYPLKDCIRDYMDKKKSTAEVKGLDFLPDEVCLKHIYSFWQLVAEARKKIKT